MDKLSRKILKFMRNHGKDTSFTCPLDDGWDFEYENMCAFADLVQALQDSEPNILSSIKWLSDNGWVEIETLHSSTGDIPVAFRLSHKGIHQKEFNRMARIEFWKKSILTPIIVSLATSVIVSSLWPTLWHWLTDWLKRILR